MLWKILQRPQQNPVPGSLSKKAANIQPTNLKFLKKGDSDTGASLWILWNYGVVLVSLPLTSNKSSSFS